MTTNFKFKIGDVIAVNGMPKTITAIGDSMFLAKSDFIEESLKGDE